MKRTAGINYVDLRLHFGKNEKITRWRSAIVLKNVEKTYKSSDYSTTFTASRMAWVAKEWENTVELAFGVFFALRLSSN